jgi:hypothetical protein
MGNPDTNPNPPVQSTGFFTPGRLLVTGIMLGAIFAYNYYKETPVQGPVLPSPQGSIAVQRSQVARICIQTLTRQLPVITATTLTPTDDETGKRLKDLKKSIECMEESRCEHMFLSDATMEWMESLCEQNYREACNVLTLYFHYLSGVDRGILANLPFFTSEILCKPEWSGFAIILGKYSEGILDQVDDQLDGVRLNDNMLFYVSPSSKGAKVQIPKRGGYKTIFFSPGAMERRQTY